MRAEHILHDQFGKTLTDCIHAATFRAVCRVAGAVAGARALNCAAVGRALAGPSPAKHFIKAVDRLLGNQLLQKRILLFYVALAARLVIRKRPYLLIDWTDIGTRWSALVVSAVVGGRGVVIFSETYPKSMTNNPNAEAKCLRVLRGILPPGCRPVLIGDAGFRSTFITKVRELGWDFVCRVRGRVYVRRPDDGAWQRVKELWPTRCSQPRCLGLFDLARYRPTRVRIVVCRKRHHPKKQERRIGRRKKRAIRAAREPWVLATSLDAPADTVVAAYALRMRIEETFRDQKCPRFGLGLDQTRTEQRERMRVFLLLAALAHFLTLLVGTLAERHELHRGFQANTVRNRRVLSLFRIGREILAQLRFQGPSLWPRELLRGLSPLTTLGLG